MKRFWIVSILMLFCTTSYMVAQGNQQDEKITVSTSDLTPAQLLKIKADQEAKDLQAKLTTYGNWVGVGGEIGKGVKEGLTAVVDVADKFGSTKVGTFTMIMVAWKIIGRDILRIFIGIIFVIVATIFIFKSYRKLTTHRICIKSNGWQFWLPKEYKIIEPEDFEGKEFVKVLYLIMLVGAFGIGYALMFV